MHSPMPKERRRSPRRSLYRMAKIKVGVGILAHDCIVIDISDNGVQLHVPGFRAMRQWSVIAVGHFDQAIELNRALHCFRSQVSNSLGSETPIIGVSFDGEGLDFPKCQGLVSSSMAKALTFLSVKAFSV
jgi:hypothetical protein